jgi:hypothetical protein
MKKLSRSLRRPKPWRWRMIFRTMGLGPNPRLNKPNKRGRKKAAHDAAANPAPATIDRDDLDETVEQTDHRALDGATGDLSTGR